MPLILLIPAVWLAVIALVVILCLAAARADEELRRAERRYSPRPPSTWGTVRSRILTSVQSDQLATYR